MSRFGRDAKFWQVIVSLLVVCPLLQGGLLIHERDCAAAELLLKDGRIVKGALGAVASLADQPQAPATDGVGPLRLIILLNDDLRRTFVSKRQIQEVRQANIDQVVEEQFNIRQRTLRYGRRVASVGPVVEIRPFDEFGRRIFTFNTAQGPVDVIQGISLLTPSWAQVEGISHVWDMRVATSSIPHEVLHKILLKQIDPKNIEHRKKIARFYLQAERYAEARQTLEDLIKDFPERPELQQQLTPTIRSLRQLSAQRLLSELRMRRRAGQHRLVYGKLDAFPSEDVAGEILQAVREMADEYAGYKTRGQNVIEQLDAEIAKISDTATRERIRPIRDEIVAELNINTLGRLTSFEQSVDDQQLTPNEKVALAVSGWLLGSDAAQEKLPVALSLYRVRELVVQYMNEPVKLGRAKILGLLGSEEGAVPSYVAGLLAHMKPPEAAPEPVAADKPGFYRVEIEGLDGQPPFTYYVQLPPEYDPYRRYPTIVTLHGSGTTAEQQIDWWAGEWTKDGWRAGQASRRGYIVIAPQWMVEHQKNYRYSPREHACVLYSLRDACRRFSVDTDQVFLTGHSIGGDAAWDLGLAHPDLWAGVLPIVARAEKYCDLYWENAERVPFYVVCGELDGAQLTKNADTLDRYLKRGFNCTVVEYLGRGHEHFYDEILRMFDWMSRFRRDFYPKEFTCKTMRPWDNFFWWIELDGMPSKSMVDPADWPPSRGTQPVEVSAKITPNNGIYVRSGSTRVCVWLSPAMVDLKQRVSIVVNGRRMNNREPYVKPSLETMLEDARTRGDRQHPFWARFEMPTGRVSGS